MPPPLKKRRTQPTSVDEITFDTAARQEYLTGFHKRKLQRSKHAQEVAEKKARTERIEQRRKLREERKADLERHVHEVNALLKPDLDSDGSESVNEVSDASAGLDAGSDPSEIDHEAEYVDEDRFTTITVQAMDVSKEGIYKAEQARERGSDEDKDKDNLARRDEEDIRKSKRRGRKQWSPTKTLCSPRKKRRKFRYESKAERKVARMKEKSKNSKKAKARRAA